MLLVMGSFTRRQIYTGNGAYRRVRKGESTTASIPPPTDRERILLQQYKDAVTAVLADPNSQYTHLAKLLESPGVGRLDVIDNFPWHEFEIKYREVQQTLVDQLRQGAGDEAGKIHFDFQSKDPETLLYGAKHAADHVTNIVEEQRQILRNMVIRSELDGVAPKALAHDIRNVVGLTPAWAGAVTKYHRGMLAKGVDPAFAAKQAQKYHARLVTARAEMIARTEIMRASNHGKILAWKSAISHGVMTGGGRKRWLTAVTNVCPVCLPMDGQAVDLDSTFTVASKYRVWQVEVPPSHPSCRCTISYLPPTIEDLTGISEEEWLSQIQDGTYEDTLSAAPPEPELSPIDFGPPEWVDDPTQLPDPPPFAYLSTLPDIQQWATEVLSPISPTLSSLPSPRNFDYTGLSPEVAHVLTQRTVEFARDYPAVWQETQGIGTLQEVFRSLPNFDQSQFGNDTYAVTSWDPDHGPAKGYLGLNRYWFSPSMEPQFESVYQNDITLGFHPLLNPGFSPLDATIIHEQGHLLTFHAAYHHQDAINAELDQTFRKITGYPMALSNTFVQGIVKKEVSGYGGQNLWEFLAECWSMYRCSPNPSPLAVAMSEILMKYNR